ncbi:MAG: hypothetical protein ACRDKJ_03585 [Actinomycetota bacterium]
MLTSAGARALSLVGLGAAGLVGGHAIGYALAVPDFHHRSTLLVETGHGYVPSASWVAVALGLAAVVAGIMSGCVRRPTSGEPAFGRTVTRMLPAQVGAFIALEIFERVASGAPLSFSSRLVALGVVAQIAVSVVGAMLLAGLRRLGYALTGAVRAVPLSVSSGRVPELVRCVGGQERRWRRRVRAPPRARLA